MDYDRNSIDSIEEYAKKLIGRTFLDILKNKNLAVGDYENIIQKYSNKNRKGGLGNFLEEIYFDFRANSDKRPDFHEVGLELKVSPYEITTKGIYKAGERLVITMIDYNNPVHHDFFTSHLWEKIAKILLIYYLRDRQKQNNLDFRIDFVNLFTPNENDLEIIKEDYKKIIYKIETGHAELLSESDTMYLAACTKGATAESSLVSQYYNPDVKAKKRAFSLKQSYMSSVLNSFVDEKMSSAESIVKNKTDLEKAPFETIVLKKIAEYYGMNDYDLCHKFERTYNNNKSQWIDLAYRMLGIKSNKASEFVKANIIVKTIRLEENGSMKENISFPAFNFKELIQEDWEDSDIYNYFTTTKFLFVIFKKRGTRYVLDSAKFWNMPLEDLEGEVKECWLTTVGKIKNGIYFIKSGDRILNDLPSSKDNRVMHVRPHAAKSAYSLKDGTEIGDIKRNANELPDGQWMTNQSFWLNNSYVLENIVKGKVQSKAFA